MMSPHYYVAVCPQYLTLPNKSLGPVFSKTSDAIISIFRMPGVSVVLDPVFLMVASQSQETQSAQTTLTVSVGEPKPSQSCGLNYQQYTFYIPKF